MHHYNGVPIKKTVNVTILIINKATAISHRPHEYSFTNAYLRFDFVKFVHLKLCAFHLNRGFFFWYICFKYRPMAVVSAINDHKKSNIMFFFAILFEM